MQSHKNVLQHNQGKHPVLAQLKNQVMLLQILKSLVIMDLEFISNGYKDGQKMQAELNSI